MAAAALLAEGTARAARRAAERLVEADALLVHGLALRALGDGPAAERSLSAVRALAVELPYPALAARLRHNPS